jgi:leucine zipper transcription factor-like protein 1
MAESPFGVNEAHSGVILDFLHFARSRRGRCLKSVEVEFQNLIESRLMDDTFTSEEVKDMVSGLCAVVKGEMETELIHASHTHSLLVAQLLQQAETWHLNMKVDISALENKELLETLAQYEQQQFSSSALPDSAHKATLIPLDHSGGDKLLQMQISRLEEENDKLQQRLRSVESKFAGALSERDELKKQLEATPTIDITPTPQNDDVIALQETVAELQEKLYEKDTSSSSGNADMERELEEKSKELLKTKAELEAVRADLDRKFSETAQYANMRKMLSTKNDQIKELRSQLRKYES